MGAVGAARRSGRRTKLLPLVGYVSKYRRFYGRGFWGVRKEAVILIRFGTYNIRNGWNGGLKSALHGMLQANVDLGVSRKPRLLMGYTRRNIAVIGWRRHSLREHTLGALPCSIARRSASPWRRSRSTVQTPRAFRWRQAASSSTLCGATWN